MAIPSRRPQTTVCSVLIPKELPLGVAAGWDRIPAEPDIRNMILIQLIRKTARGKNGGIGIEGCGIWVERDTTGSSVSSCMSSGLAGLPDHPVTEVDTQALNQHSALDFCHPVYRLSDDPDSIVVIALAKDDRAYFLYFNPEDQQWEQLVATDIPEAVTDEIPFDEEEVDERLGQCYDEEEIEPAGYRNNPLLSAIQGFPDEPLTEQQIEMIQNQHPMIGEVMPLVNRVEDNGTIALIFFFDDFIGEQRITAAVGYEPTIGEWQLIDSAESSDPNLDHTLEQLRDAYANWVATHYTSDEIQAIEDPDAALTS